MSRASQSQEFVASLEEAGIVPGGANFMTALALLCYTDFAGGLTVDGSATTTTFHDFICRMGEGYAQLLNDGLNIYRVFRCGMAHEYFAKGDIEVSMVGSPNIGLGRRADGALYFCVSKYYEDFIQAFDALGIELGLTTQRPDIAT